jgi:dynein heavy chain, axonemal
MSNDRRKKDSAEVDEYYTISLKGFCHYKGGKPIEFIPLYKWVKERETYDEIKSLQFFTKFRKWKTLKMWKKSCK